MAQTQNMALLVIAILVVAVLAVVVMRGAPAGQLAVPGKQTCYWTTVFGSFIVDNVVETAVGDCTWRDDNFDVFDFGVCTVNGITEYRDTCVSGNPDINMREYSCKYVLVNGTTTDYLVTTEGTCTLGCKDSSASLSLDTATPNGACIKSVKVRECGSSAPAQF